MPILSTMTVGLVSGTLLTTEIQTPVQLLIPLNCNGCKPNFLVLALGMPPTAD